MFSEKAALVGFIRATIKVDDELAIRMTADFKYREFRKGTLFLKEGEISNEYLFLESGYMRTYVNDMDGNEVTVHFYNPNSVVMEVASFFQRVPTQENIQALDDCKAWIIDFESLNNLFHSIPQFREFGRAMLVKGFVALKIRSLGMINKTAEQRYDLLLKSNPDIFQAAPLKHIASYLGITDTSLSRIRKEYARK